MMLRYLMAAVATGLAFGMLDALINGNPFASKLMECYKPIARASINIPAGILIDLIYGFVISGVFLLISPALPTESGLIKGAVYGLGIWFFRVLMGAVSNWMMFAIPWKLLIYILLTGLVEMLLLGIVNGLIMTRH